MFAFLSATSGFKNRECNFFWFLFVKENLDLSGKQRLETQEKHVLEKVYRTRRSKSLSEQWDCQDREKESKQRFSWEYPQSKRRSKYIIIMYIQKIFFLILSVNKSFQSVYLITIIMFVFRCYTMFKSLFIFFQILDDVEQLYYLSNSLFSSDD